jgi:hypothetical protein
LGEVKWLQHKKVYILEEAGQPVLKQSVKAAWANGKAHIAPMKEGTTRLDKPNLPQGAEPNG